MFLQKESYTVYDFCLTEPYISSLLPLVQAILFITFAQYYNIPFFIYATLHALT